MAKRGQGGAKVAQKGTKMAQVELRRGSLGAKVAPRAPLEEPRGTQDDPMGTQRGPRAENLKTHILHSASIPLLLGLESLSLLRFLKGFGGYFDFLPPLTLIPLGALLVVH